MGMDLTKYRIEPFTKRNKNLYLDIVDDSDSNWFDEHLCVLNEEKIDEYLKQVGYDPELAIYDDDRQYVTIMSDELEQTRSLWSTISNAKYKNYNAFSEEELEEVYEGLDEISEKIIELYDKEIQDAIDNNTYIASVKDVHPKLTDIVGLKYGTSCDEVGYIRKPFRKESTGIEHDENGNCVIVVGNFGGQSEEEYAKIKELLDKGFGSFDSARVVFIPDHNRILKELGTYVHGYEKEQWERVFPLKENEYCVIDW